MLQAAQASLASVSGMPNRREIVAAAAERYLACNNALSATLACEERTVRRIAEIEQCMRHAEYRATVEQRKVDADSRAVLERMPVDLRRLVGKQVYSVGVGPLAFAVGDVVVCEHSACSKRSHAGDLFIIVCVVSADEDTAMVVYDVDEGSGAPSAVSASKIVRVAKSPSSSGRANSTSSPSVDFTTTYFIRFSPRSSPPSVTPAARSTSTSGTPA